MTDKIESVGARSSSFELRLADDELSVRLDIAHGDKPMSYEIVAVDSDGGLMIRRIND